MRSKSMLLLALALGCGLIASMGISQILARNNGPAIDPTEMQPIIVALDTITAHETLTAQNIKLEEWPKNKVPEGALTKLEDVEGKRCRTKLFPGEPVLAGKLVGADGLKSADDEIPPGMTIATISVNLVSGSSGLIQPGDRVNVVAFFKRNIADGVPFTGVKKVLDNIKVFAVDTQYVGKEGSEEEAPAAKTISLLVTEKQNSLVQMAGKLGEVQLVLRAPGDAKSENVETNINELFGNIEQAPPPKRQQTTRNSDENAAGLVAFLNAAVANVKKARSEAPAPQTAVVAEPPKKDTWKMMVQNGDEAPEEIEFNEKGEPLSYPAASQASDLPAGLSPTTAPGPTAPTSQVPQPTFPPVSIPTLPAAPASSNWGGGATLVK